MFLKNASAFLFLITCVTSYAQESKPVVENTTTEGEEKKAAFILNLLGDETEKSLFVSEDTGEVVVKTDKLFASSEETGLPIPVELMNKEDKPSMSLASSQLGNEETGLPIPVELMNKEEKPSMSLASSQLGNEETGLPIPVELMNKEEKPSMLLASSERGTSGNSESPNEESPILETLI